MDQTDFQENQEILQAPPIIDGPVTDVSVIKPKMSKQIKLLIASLGFLAFVLILGIIVTLSQSSSTGTTQPILNFETPTKEPSQFTTRFRSLQSQLTEYDPTVIELAPPPVNYQIFDPPRQ